MTREQIQQAYIRVCRDSGFALEWSRAANISARALGVHPMDIWRAIGTIETMERIARGVHPAANQNATGTNTAN